MRRRMEMSYVTLCLIMSCTVAIERYAHHNCSVQGIMSVVDVRNSCGFIMQNAQHVTIDDAAIAAESSFDAYHALITDWADCTCHFCERDSDLTAQYVLVLDALNFCFWPLEGYEYDDLAGSLKRALLADRTAFDADNLAKLTSEQLTSWLRTKPDQQIPLIDERSRLLREIGTSLNASFGGSAAALVRAAHHSAVRLVELVLQHFPGFRDASVYRGRQSFFYKRAQIFVGDIWGAYKGTELGRFDDISKLTCFADYRIPQLLRPLGILKYSDALSAQIDAKTEIAVGSEAELEIRAATVVAVDRLCAALQAKGVKDVMPVTLDWLLWQRGEVLNNEQKIKPHHRVLTIFY